FLIASEAHESLEREAVFSFLYLKKLKFQKYMSVLKIFKNIPRSPYGGATGLKCIFFLQICNEVPAEKKEGPCRPPPPPTGDRPLSPTPRATGACRQLGGRQGPFPRFKPWPPFATIPFVI